jgi:hypothetical protein
MSVVAELLGTFVLLGPDSKALMLTNTGRLDTGKRRQFCLFVFCLSGQIAAAVKVKTEQRVYWLKTSRLDCNMY